ncbi:carboxy-terminal domain RNA polymerase II polypeptide a small phohatase 1 [Obelidium mucronatum]|nr:carboxy-terminal domain RNA polymerase II polypeptide a small phohatase 1 [Obelidium mucronatum]
MPDATNTEAPQDVPVVVIIDMKTPPQTAGENEGTSDNDDDALGFDPSLLVTQVPESEHSSPVTHRDSHSHKSSSRRTSLLATQIEPIRESPKPTMIANEKQPQHTSLTSCFCFHFPPSTLSNPSSTVKNSKQSTQIVSWVPDKLQFMTTDSTPAGPLLPPIDPKRDSGKKHLILDLDETLVHSSFKPTAQKPDYIIKVNFKGKFHNIYVSKRPHVDSFLKAMGREFEVIVFTASTSNYANPVIDLLDPRRDLVRHRLFRESCVKYKGVYVKDLTKLGRPLKDCIIVDNSPLAYAFQPENAVACQSWYSDPVDDELRELTPFLLKLRNVEDVRVELSIHSDYEL